jgi:hypothetical protein
MVRVFARVPVWRVPLALGGCQRRRAEQADLARLPRDLGATPSWSLMVLPEAAVAVAARAVLPVKVRVPRQLVVVGAQVDGTLAARRPIA